jgi:predicted aldo/keto reductase-like oxidoreductase
MGKPMPADDRLTSRREFMKRGAAGLAAGALLPSCASRNERPFVRKEHLSTHRALGGTDLKLPVVSMGSIYAPELIHAALDMGVAYIHTSPGYGENNHERLLGRVFRERGRDSFAVGTSPDLPYRYPRWRSRSMDLGLEVDPGRIAESMDESLQRLGLDHVDVFYLLSVGAREVRHEPYMDAFRKLKEAGKTRFVGIGTHENEPEVIRAAVATGFWDIVLTSFNFRQSHREEVRAAIHEAAGQGLGVMAMKTQAGVYWDRAGTRMINMKAALKWVLQDESVHTTIPAMATFEELEENLSIMEDLSLTPEELSDLGLGERLGLSGLFCQQCRRCLDRCPSGFDIPTVMRAHMYATGHGRPLMARRLLHSWTAADIGCRRCDRCEVECTLGLDLRSSALQVASLLETRA